MVPRTATSPTSNEMRLCVCLYDSSSSPCSHTHAHTRPCRSDYKKPLNIGSDEMVSMNEMARMALDLDGRSMPIRHIPGPEGVRGRNSDNTLIKEVLGWAPSITLRDGLAETYTWIKTQVEAEREKGVDVRQYGQSKVVTQTTDSLDKLKA